MPSRPSNITDVTSPEGLHVLNQAIRELHIRIDQAQKQLPVHKILKTVASLNFGAIAANTTVERSARLNGVTQAGSAHASPQLTLGNANLIWSAYISSPGTVTVRLLNPTAGSVTPNTVNWTLTVTI